MSVDSTSFLYKIFLLFFKLINLNYTEKAMYHVCWNTMGVIYLIISRIKRKKVTNDNGGILLKRNFKFEKELYKG